MHAYFRVRNRMICDFDIGRSVVPSHEPHKRPAPRREKLIFKTRSSGALKRIGPLKRCLLCEPIKKTLTLRTKFRIDKGSWTKEVYNWGSAQQGFPKRRECTTGAQPHFFVAEIERSSSRSSSQRKKEKFCHLYINLLTTVIRGY